jgi:hypothetical protein
MIVRVCDHILLGRQSCSKHWVEIDAVHESWTDSPLQWEIFCLKISPSNSLETNLWQLLGDRYLDARQTVPEAPSSHTCHMQFNIVQFSSQTHWVGPKVGLNDNVFVWWCPLFSALKEQKEEKQRFVQNEWYSFRWLGTCHKNTRKFFTFSSA